MSAVDSSPRIRRAPALQIAGRITPDAPLAYYFRLPCPPAWDDRPPSARAAHRRARKAYFAVLEAMRTGHFDPELVERIEQFMAETRSRSARVALLHLRQVLSAVQRSPGASLLPSPPPAPLTTVVAAISVMPPIASTTEARLGVYERLASRYEWTLEWMRMHRYIAGKELELSWRIGPHTAGPPARVAMYDGRVAALVT